ncbi:ABC transporter substrate-binding protein [Paenibacillus cremeus]|uniref:Carbohydrate ABC transporter substrate-binding protein n=1 Tax=Paenibacillus cremeus TaxID=2163881 RepID=A0A559KE12_9BACL|nr:ABC transporter substrate-binding protein [Paenibacillus cremeus]TVY10349.1 carbohydrate ABC transporter substrate-binding protein [Paenibacillus cremeus]
MGRRLNFFVPILASTALFAGLAGCGAPANVSTKEDPNAKITLKVAWWGSQDRNDRTQKVIQMFETKYPNIHIETEYAGFKDYWTKMATEAAGQSLPDVMQMDYAYLGEYTSRKLVSPLDSYVQSGALNLKDADDPYIVGGKVNNQLFAVNLGANAPAVAIDPGAFEKAGIAIPKEGYTYDDMMNLTRQLKSKSGNSNFFPIDCNATSDSGLDFGYYLRQRGTSLYNKDGNGLGYTDDKLLVDFFTLDQALVKEGLMAPPQVLKGISSEPDTLLVKGNAAFHPFTSNLITAYSTYAKRPLQLIPFPGYSGGQEGNYLKPSQFFSVASSSKYKDAAVKFIDFFTNDLNANDILLAERGVPISSKVREHIMPKLDQATQQQFTYIEYVQKHSRPIDPPSPKGASNVSDLFTRVQDSVLYGQVSPADAAKQFRTEATSILSSNK